MSAANFPLPPRHFRSNEARLREMVDRRIAESPRAAELRERLLRLGGTEAVFFFPDLDLPALLDRGRVFPGQGSRLRVMEANHCCENAASLWHESGRRTKIVVGYALSEDGLWRQHCWGLRDGRVVETTVRRVLYYGYELDPGESVLFALIYPPRKLQQLAANVLPDGPRVKDYLDRLIAGCDVDELDAIRTSLAARMNLLRRATTTPASGN